MKRWKNALSSLLTLLAVLLAAFLVFRGHWEEIWANLRGAPPEGVLALFILAAAYQLLESGICAVLVRARLPGFSFREAMEVTFLGVFGNVATFAVGSIPMQSLRLRQCGLTIGHGVGMMTVEYIFHKTSILLYAAAMLLLQGSWLRKTAPELQRWLLPGFGVCAAIAGALVLVCTWGRLKDLVLRLIGLLPETEKWERRKTAWRVNLESLYAESQHVLKSRACCGKILLLNAAKLLCLYSAAYLAVELLGAEGLSFGRAQLLASLMLLIASALPNVAGVGPAEFAFLLLFGRYMDYAQASAALILYRTATYFFPFAVSVLFTLHIQRRSWTGGSSGEMEAGGEGEPFQSPPAPRGETIE